MEKEHCSEDSQSHCRSRVAAAAAPSAAAAAATPRVAAAVAAAPSAAAATAISPCIFFFFSRNETSLNKTDSKSVPAAQTETTALPSLVDHPPYP